MNIISGIDSMMNKAIKRAYSRMEKHSVARAALAGYFTLLKVNESIYYKLNQKKIKGSVIVLTFDDAVDKSNIKVAKFLKSEDIKATFFVPAGSVHPSVLKSLSMMGHELAGHGVYHSKNERAEEYITSAKKCMAILRKYDKNAMSWRFPWLSYTRQCVLNVMQAGFQIDSSVHCFYAQQKPADLAGMKEMRFLRLPTPHGMDLEAASYFRIEKFILKKSMESGIIVLPFHVYEQARYFDEFTLLIRKMKRMGVSFMTLREAQGMV